MVHGAYLPLSYIGIIIIIIITCDLVDTLWQGSHPVIIITIVIIIIIVVVVIVFVVFTVRVSWVTIMPLMVSTNAQLLYYSYYDKHSYICWVFPKATALISVNLMITVPGSHAYEVNSRNVICRRKF
jgi:hypothetical protein